MHDTTSSTEPVRPGSALPPPQPTSSDRQVDTDWWLASDGRWYAPTATSAPPIPPPPYPPGMSGAPARTAVSSGVSGTAQGFLWAAGAFSVFVAVVSIAGADAYSRWDEATTSSSRRQAYDDMIDADGAITSLLGLHALLSLVIFILLIIFMNQAHKATQSLWPGTRSWSSGWTVGAWFIPVAQFIIPKLVINEIERISRAPRGLDGLVASGWERISLWAVGLWWWLSFVPGVILATAGNSMFQGDDSDRWGTGYWCLTIGHGLLAVSAMLCVFYMRRIVRSLS